MFCCGVPPGLTMNILVWGKENSYFWRIYSLGMCFGQDPVSTNMPKAKILMDSFEEQDWALLLHPWRIAVPHMSPWGRGLAWVGLGSAETHNRPDLLTALKGSASQTEVATFCVVNHQNFSELMSVMPALAALKNHESSLEKQWCWMKTIMRLKYVPASLRLLPGVGAYNCIHMLSPSFP